MLKALRIIGAILSVLGIIGVATGLLASSSMIVAIGIRGVSLISTLSAVSLGTGVAALAGGTIPAVIKKHSSQKQLEHDRENDRKQFSEYAKDSLNPEKTRIRLEQLRRKNPSLNTLVENCLENLDRIDTYQARHRSLLEANEAIYLEDTIEIIDESEKRICRNIRNIINCCILVEDSKSSVNELDDNIIRSSLSDNEEELKTVATLLKYSVAYINNYNRSGVSDRSELDAWLKVMKSSMGGNNEKQ
ncbi:hypothetical protein [Ruminococcus sp.]|uniref:hypothetical protein n=1 Tax=Ruminococcus sp. TaxID=41978 RepID=UPI002E7793F1|nr:hypothetical protein [Ruminococcus sp.]MEE1261785.1 hypothetical protein [Ruminococcus sp.]